MNKNFSSTIILCLVLWVSGTAIAQDSTWTLQKCIAYAKANNLSIQQQVLNERVAKMQLEQSRLSVLPNVSISSSYGRNFGRSIDPTSNTFNNTTYDFTGLSGSASVLLFGWFRTRNTIAKTDLQYQVSEADLSQLQNDIALNVTNGYLRILLAREQVSICLNQIDVTIKQIKQTESLLAAGRSNGLEVAQVKTQLIADSANYFKAQLDFQLATIDEKALLNLEINEPFVTSFPDNQKIDQAIVMFDPETIYKEAEFKLGGIRSLDLKVRSAEKDLAIAKSNLYPQLTFSASSGSNYSSTYNEILQNGESHMMPLGKQFQNNFSQSVYLGLSIPLFNGLSSRYTIRQAKIGVQNSIIQSKAAKLKLKRDIYKACNEVQAAFQTYRAARSAAATTKTGLDFAQKRYEKGLISAMELLLSQNTFFKANSEEAASKYELIFKLEVIDQYN